jgi:ubiquinone/menaquinone biosynthesis C-methylase UbiE
MAVSTTQHDVWASGDAYEPFVGRWSRRAAREFIAWLALAANSRWLDVGCGTGALTQTILTTADPCEVLGVDPSEGFVAYARDHTQDSRAKFEVGNAQALPAASSSFDVAVAGLVLNFVPDPVRATAEMRRAVRVGGTNYQIPKCPLSGHPDRWNQCPLLGGKADIGSRAAQQR